MKAWNQYIEKHERLDREFSALSSVLSEVKDTLQKISGDTINDTTVHKNTRFVRSDTITKTTEIHYVIMTFYVIYRSLIMMEKVLAEKKGSLRSLEKLSEQVKRSTAEDGHEPITSQVSLMIVVWA